MTSSVTKAIPQCPYQIITPYYGHSETAGQA